MEAGAVLTCLGTRRRPWRLCPSILQRRRPSQELTWRSQMPHQTSSMTPSAPAAFSVANCRSRSLARWLGLRSTSCGRQQNYATRQANTSMQLAPGSYAYVTLNATTLTLLSGANDEPQR